ncbi:MAG: hypothetical protein JW768_13230 [Chitinispirillaceae bacterium]|nr:hypothetical protein [Chitinispirillaceae bacterium]
MDPVRGQNSWRENAALKYGMPGAFSIAVFIYILFYVHPAVIHTSNGFHLPSYVRYLRLIESDTAPVPDPNRYSGDGFILETTSRYFKDLFSVPGGLTRLLVTFFIYACHYPVIGALSLTALALLLLFLFQRYCWVCYGARPLVTGYLIFPALLIVCNLYELDFLSFIIPAAGALGAAVLYQWVAEKNLLARFFAALLLFWLAWYLMQWAAVVFLLLAVIHERYQRPRLRRGIGVAVIALINVGVLFLVESVLLSPDHVMRAGDLFSPVFPPVIALLYYPFVSLLFSPAALRLMFRGPLKILFAIPAPVRRSVQVVMVVAITSGALLVVQRSSVLGDVRAVAHAIHDIQHDKWDDILSRDYAAQFISFPEKNGPLQQYLIHARNSALAHTGKLGAKMFAYPQASFSPEPLMLRESIQVFGFPQWAAAIDLFMDLGMVNYAEKTIGELMECMGPYPFLMYRRSLLHVAKNNSEAASVYLHKLRGMPFYRKEAEKLLSALGDSVTLAAHPFIARLRASMDTVDHFFLSGTEEDLLLFLLDRNPKNKLAFDYLMAYYLLTGKVKKLVAQLPRAPAFGYTLLPRHWEEAFCVYMAQEDETAEKIVPPDLPMIVPQTFKMFEQFLEISSRLENNPGKAETLGKVFGSTYYFFYTFEYSKGERQ